MKVSKILFLSANISEYLAGGLILEQVYCVTVSLCTSLQDISLSTMAKLSTAIVSLALLFNGVSALVPSNVPKTKRPAFDAKRAATNSMAAASIASALVIGPMADAVDMAMDTPSFGSSSLVAERVTREGLYREYDVEVPDQVYDDARSTYKSAKETKTKKGKNLAGALTRLYHLCLYALTQI